MHKNLVASPPLPTGNLLDYSSGVEGCVPYFTPSHSHAFPRVTLLVFQLKSVLWVHVACFGQWNVEKKVEAIPEEKAHLPVYSSYPSATPFWFWRMKGTWNRVTLPISKAVSMIIHAYYYVPLKFGVVRYAVCLW